METWKPIKDYEGLYEVSNEGNVRRVIGDIIAILFHTDRVIEWLKK